MFKSFLKSLAVVSVAAGSLAAGAQSVVTQIPMDGSSQGIAINFATNRIYAAVPSLSGTTDILQVIDGSADTVINSITVPAMAYSVAVNIFTNQVYLGGCVVATQQCSVLVIDGSTNEIKNTIPITTATSRVGRNGLFSMAVNPLTGRLYISDAVNDTIDIVNRDATAVSETISLGGIKPNALALNPLDGRLYVGMANGTVNVIKDDRIIATTSVGGRNTGVSVNWLTGHVFVTNATATTTAVLNAAGAVKTTINVGSNPFAVDVDFASNLAFVTNLGSSSVSVIDGSTNTVKATVSVPSPFFVAVNPITKKAYVDSGRNLVVISEQ